MHAKWFAIASSIAVFLFVVELIRKQKMTFKYSVAWLATSAAALFLALDQRLLFRLSEWAGFTLPSNFIFFLLTIFVILLSLLLTIYINEQNNRSEILAQAIAQMEYQIKQLKDLLRPKGPGGGREG